MDKKIKSKLFWSLIEEVSNNLGYKYTEILNMFKHIFVHNSKLIQPTTDKNHGRSFGFLCQLSNGMNFKDSFVNKHGKVDPRLIARLKLLCKELLEEPHFVNPFKR